LYYCVFFAHISNYLDKLIVYISSLINSFFKTNHYIVPDIYQLFNIQIFPNIQSKYNNYYLRFF